MRLTSLILVLCFVGFAIGTVERILNLAIQIIPTVVKDSKKQEMYKNVFISAKPCLEPVANKAGEDTVEKFLEVMLPMGSDCSQQTEGIEELHDRRKAFMKCFYEKVDKFLEGKSQSDKDAFKETQKCLKEIFGSHD